MSCDHKFVDSNVCLKCGVSIGALRAADADELEAVIELAARLREARIARHRQQLRQRGVTVPRSSGRKK